MKVGTTRYALMLDEAGVPDDGVIARLGAEHSISPRRLQVRRTSTANHVFRQCGGWTAAL